MIKVERLTVNFGMRGAFPLVTALFVLLVGCDQAPERGGFGSLPPPSPSRSSSPSPAVEDGPDRRLEVTVPGSLSYTPDRLRARAGETVELVLRNEDDVEHTLVMDRLPVAILAGPGQEITAEVRTDEANTGRFAFFCTIDGHRAAGMEGTLRVR